MRTLLLIACVASAAFAATVMTPIASDFIGLMREMEQQPFFRDVFEDKDRVLSFEMLTAAETGNLGQLLEKMEYIPLFKYLDLLPKEYQHRFIAYVVTHLENEGSPVDSPLLKPAPSS